MRIIVAKLNAVTARLRGPRLVTAPGSTFQVGRKSPQYRNKQLANANRLLEMGEFETAEPILRRLVQEKPREAEFLASLAICVAQSQGRYVSAEKLAEKARRLSPDQACGWFALGYINLLGSRLERGHYFLSESRKRDPRDPRVRYGLDAWQRRRPPVIADLAHDHIVNRLLGGIRRIFTDRRVMLASAGWLAYQLMALVMIR